MSLQQLRYRVEQLKGQRAQVAADVQAGRNAVAALDADLHCAEEARAVIQTVAQQTQRQLEYHVSEIVSLALAAVFDRPYALRLAFVERRNKTEADLLFERDGEQFRPVDASGGGAVDVAALALRVAMWTLRRPRSRATLVLDEPLRFLSRDLMPKAAAMLAEVSQRLGLQIIMVSHSQELIEGADRYFTVEMHKGVSHVTTGEDKEESVGQGDTTAGGGDGVGRYDKAGAQHGDARRGEPAHAAASKSGKHSHRRDNGNPQAEQRGLDAGTPAGDGPRARRDQGSDARDHGQRSPRQPADSATRRRRT